MSVGVPLSFLRFPHSWAAAKAATERRRGVERQHNAGPDGGVAGRHSDVGDVNSFGCACRAMYWSPDDHVSLQRDWKELRESAQPLRGQLRSILTLLKELVHVDFGGTSEASLYRTCYGASSSPKTG